MAVGPLGGVCGGPAGIAYGARHGAARRPPGARLGLSTALGVLRAGFVLVGNVPTKDGTSPTAGSLLVINRSGSQIAEWMPPAAKINGPWDLTIFDEGDQAKVFVSNVLDGTVTRLDVSIDDNGERCDLAPDRAQQSVGEQEAAVPSTLIVLIDGESAQKRRRDEWIARGSLRVISAGNSVSFTPVAESV